MRDSHLTNEEKLERIYEMTLENHEMLDGMRKRERLANSIRVLYWIIVIGALGGAYYYIRPVIDSVSRHRADVEGTLNQFEQFRESLPQTKAIGEFLRGLQSGVTGDVATSTPTPQ